MLSCVVSGAFADLCVHEQTTELGQCHFMVLDPDGAVVDVIERVPMTAEDRRHLARYRRDHRAEHPTERSSGTS